MRSESSRRIERRRSLRRRELFQLQLESLEQERDDLQASRDKTIKRCNEMLVQMQQRVRAAEAKCRDAMASRDLAQRAQLQQSSIVRRAHTLLTKAARGGGSLSDH